jgi:isochorismate synthase
MQHTDSVLKPLWDIRKQVLQHLLQGALEQGFSFSLWRTPSDETVKLIICREAEWCDEVSLEDSTSGFLIAPFLPESKKVFLKADQYFEFTKERIIKNGEEIDLPIEDKPNQVRLAFHYPRTDRSALLESGDSFLNLVHQGIQEIEKGVFEKIVPSRCKKVELSPDADLIGYFERLSTTYPNALISLTSTPLTGTWLGATPELLVKVDSNQVFHTVALAGTQRYIQGTDLKSISWTQKDIEEQALVSRYIINCFKKIRLREFDEHGPKTVLAGNVLHLKTEFKADMAATNFPQLGTVMLKLLHPTSAVCGMPLDNALHFLTTREGYDRELYSGYLGPVNIQRETQLYVNLRCLQAFPSNAILYAGAGVTIDSDPEKEWEETELKMRTLLQVIQP